MPAPTQATAPVPAPVGASRTVHVAPAFVVTDSWSLPATFRKVAAFQPQVDLEK